MGKGDTHTKKHVKRNGKASIVTTELIIPSKEEKIVKINKNISSSPVSFTLKNIKDEDLPFNAIAMGSFIAGPRKQIIKEGMYVLIFTEFNKWYIKHVYTPDDIKQLEKMKIFTIKDTLFENEQEEEINMDEI
jgi:hypothetical protein